MEYGDSSGELAKNVCACMFVQKLFIKLSSLFKPLLFEKLPIKSAFICQQEVITTYINVHIHFVTTFTDCFL